MVVGRERTTHCVVSAIKNNHRTVHCMVHNPWGTHSTVQYQYGVPPTVPSTVHIGLMRPYVVHSVVHYTKDGTLYGTLRVCHRGAGPYAVPYMVHRGLFRPSSTHSMVHSTVSCTLDGTFVPFQRLRVTLSGTPLGTQWYTGRTYWTCPETDNLLRGNNLFRTLRNVVSGGITGTKLRGDASYS